MHHIKALATFFNRSKSDHRIHTSHISIYITLFHYWHSNECRNPINISRSDLMQKTKISSKATYHKCIKDLHLAGYIVYTPSYHPVQGSKVYLVNLESGNAN